MVGEPDVIDCYVSRTANRHVGDESVQRSAELMCRPGAVKFQTVAVNQLP